MPAELLRGRFEPSQRAVHTHRPQPALLALLQSCPAHNLSPHVLCKLHRGPVWGADDMMCRDDDEISRFGAASAVNDDGPEQMVVHHRRVSSSTLSPTKITVMTRLTHLPRRAITTSDADDVVHPELVGGAARQPPRSSASPRAVPDRREPSQLTHALAPMTQLAQAHPDSRTMLRIPSPFRNSWGQSPMTQTCFFWCRRRTHDRVEHLFNRMHVGAGGGRQTGMNRFETRHDHECLGGA
jgi:hypothetical protein